MARKAYFKRRSEAQIRNMNLRRCYGEHSLLNRILNANPDDAFEVRYVIVPGIYFAGKRPDGKRTIGQQASRAYESKGPLLSILHPKTKRDFLEYSLTPREMIFDTYNKLKTKNISIEDTKYIGTSTQVRWGDRIKRVTIYSERAEAMKIFAYSENFAGGIKLSTIYSGPKQGRAKGSAYFVAQVPSREEKRRRYKFKWQDVPFDKSQPEVLASAFTMKPANVYDEESGEPEQGFTNNELYQIRFFLDSTRESEDRIIFGAHKIAAYWKYMIDQREKGNSTPFEFNPFMPFSGKLANYDRIIFNNILVYDKSLSEESRPRQLRHIHAVERSKLLGKLIRILCPEEAFWNEEKDRRLTDYDWSIP